MTSATTALALVPVLTSTGRGADVMVPMAMGFDLAQGWAAYIGPEVEAFGGIFETRDPNWSVEAGAQALTEAAKAASSSTPPPSPPTTATLPPRRVLPSGARPASSKTVTVVTSAVRKSRCE